MSKKKPRRDQCAFGVDPESLSEHDRRELEKFFDFTRRVKAANAAGVPHREAMRAIYPDVYTEDQGADK